MIPLVSINSTPMGDVARVAVTSAAREPAGGMPCVGDLGAAAAGYGTMMPTFRRLDECLALRLR
jgi:hypothetical protein